MNYLKRSLNSKKIAYVVGGLGLIGLEVSKALNDSGAKVVIIDVKPINKKFKIYLKRNNLQYYKIKNKVDKYYDNEIEKIFKKFNTPDIFVNCSYPKTNKWKNNSFKKIKFLEFKQNVDQHLISFCWFAKKVADQIKKTKKTGSIIQIGSIYGIQGQDMSLYKNTKINENASYSAIKGGIINFTKQLASYYGKYKIRVNNVCPGGVKNLKDRNQKSKLFIKRYNLKTPLSTMSDSSDVASAVLFLSSDLSKNITGQTLIIDGGLSII